jgi:uncharacterized protein (DUF1697 family)
MVPLREALVAAGVNATATVVQSGNIIVTKWSAEPEKLRSRIERVLHSVFDIDVKCLVRSREEILTTLANNPLAKRASNDTTLVVHFCEPRLESESLVALQLKGLNARDVAVSNGSLFQWCENGISNAPVLSPQLERQLGVVVTARNWRTITKVGELLSAE